MKRNYSKGLKPTCKDCIKIMSQHIEQIRYNIPPASQVKRNSNQFKDKGRKRKEGMALALYNKELNFMLLSIL